jgi:hypothetical protein
LILQYDGFRRDLALPPPVNLKNKFWMSYMLRIQSVRFITCIVTLENGVRKHMHTYISLWYSEEYVRKWMKV